MLQTELNDKSMNDVMNGLIDNYILLKQGTENDVEQVKRDLASMEAELRQREAELASKRMILQRLEEDRKAKHDAQVKAAQEAHRALTTCFNCGDVLKRERSVLKAGPHQGSVICGSNTSGCTSVFLKDDEKKAWVYPKRTSVGGVQE